MKVQEVGNVTTDGNLTSKAKQGIPNSLSNGVEKRMNNLNRSCRKSNEVSLSSRQSDMRNLNINDNYKKSVPAPNPNSEPPVSRPHFLHFWFVLDGVTRHKQEFPGDP